METFLTLDVVGVIVALVFGALILYFGGGVGIYLLLVLVLFLIASALVTRFKKKRKVAMKTYERARGWKNVVANGIVPLCISFAYYLNLNRPVFPNIVLIVAYVASVAAITADKFSSEIGILDNSPLMLVTLKKTKPGTSGGVSLLGTLAGALGSLVIGFGLISFPAFQLLLAIVFISGILGNLVDSFLGYFEVRGFGNKYTSNFFCAVTGCLFALLLGLVLI